MKHEITVNPTVFNEILNKGRTMYTQDYLSFVDNRPKPNDWLHFKECNAVDVKETATGRALVARVLYVSEYEIVHDTTGESLEFKVAINFELENYIIIKTPEDDAPEMVPLSADVPRFRRIVKKSKVESMKEPFETMDGSILPLTVVDNNGSPLYDLDVAGLTKAPDEQNLFPTTLLISRRDASGKRQLRHYVKA